MSDNSDLEDFAPKHRLYGQKQQNESDKNSESESESNTSDREKARDYNNSDSDDGVVSADEFADGVNDDSDDESPSNIRDGSNGNRKFDEGNNECKLPGNDDDEVAHIIGGLTLNNNNNSLASNIVFKKSSTALTRQHNEVVRWLTLAEKGQKYSEFIMTKPPRLPDSSEMFLVQTPGEDVYDYNVDEYTGWTSNGNNNKNSSNSKSNAEPNAKPNSKSNANPNAEPSKLLKRYWVMKVDGEKIDFKRDVYELRSSKSVPKVRLIHYYGKEQSKWHPRPHGNSKKEKNFTRNLGSTKVKIEKRLIETRKTPKPVFNELLREAAEDAEVFETRHATEAPRDRIQVRNYKAKVDNEGRLLRCEYFSVYEMAKAKQLGEFIAVIEGAPQDIVIVAEPSALQLASKLLIEASVNASLPQLLTIDTTFNLGDTYVTIVVMRNTYFEESPIFPVSFMLHCRKVKEVHVRFMEYLAKKLPFNDIVLQKVPWASDREPGLVAAIRSTLPSVNLVHCENHFVQDVKHWVLGASGSTRDDVQVYKRHLKQLVDSNSSEEVQEKYEEMKQKWTQSFIQYFEKALLGDICTRVDILAANNFAIFQNICATSNNAETHNSVLKRALGKLPLRFDSLVLALFNVQLEYLNDFHRSASGESGSGNYVLRENYKLAVKNKTWNPPFKLPVYSYWEQEKFIEYFKPGIYKHEGNIEKEGEYLQSKQAMAKATCDRGNVTLTKYQSFVVHGLYDQNQYLVTKKSGTDKFACTCISTGMCYHIIAVRYSIDEDVPKDSHVYSLHELKKQGRGYAGRAGKKKPKPQDYELHVNPAPDSAIARGKRKDVDEDDSDDEMDKIHWEEDEIPGLSARPKLKRQKSIRGNKGKSIIQNGLNVSNTTPMQTKSVPKIEISNPSTPTFTDRVNVEEKYRDLLMENMKTVCNGKPNEPNVSYMSQNIDNVPGTSTSARSQSSRIICDPITPQKGFLAESSYSLDRPHFVRKSPGCDGGASILLMDSSVNPQLHSNAIKQQQDDALCLQFDEYCKDLDKRKGKIGKANLVTADEIEDNIVSTPVIRRSIPYVHDNSRANTTVTVGNSSPSGSSRSVLSQQPGSNKDSQGSSVYECHLKDFDIANAPDYVSHKFLKKTSFKNSFKSEGWFVGDVIDEMAVGILKAFKLEDQVSLFTSYNTQYLFTHIHDPSKYLRMAAQRAPLNTDVSLFIIHTSNHWVLCVVAYRTKSIVLLNSMRGLIINMNHVFETVLQFVAASYTVAGIKFFPSEWNILVDDCVKQQDNGFDCGPFVCMFIYEIASRQFIPDTIKFDSERVRNWIVNCLQYTAGNIELKPPGRARPDRNARETFDRLIQNQGFFRFDIRNQSCMGMLLDQLRGANHGWKKCQSSGCLGAKPDEPQCFCVVCRKWRHVSCISLGVPVNVLYFTCLRCQIYQY